MDFTNVFFQVFNGIFEIFLVCYFFGTFAEPKKFKGKIFILILLTIVFILSLLFQKDVYLNFFILLVIMFSLSFLYKMKWYNNIFLSLVIMVFAAFSELVIAVMSSAILSVPLNTLKTGFYLIVGMLLSKLLVFIILAFIKLGRHSMPIKKLGILWIYLVLMSTTSIILILMISDYMYSVSSEPIKQSLITYSLILLIIGNVLLFYVIDKMRDYFITQQNLEIANQMIDNQKQAYYELFESQNEVKKTKHDLKNIMIGILHQLEVGETSKAKEEIKRNCEVLISERDNFICGNSIVDSLLNIKKTIAKEKGITFNIETELLKPIKINVIDFSVILGNAIDNAIEATSLVKNHKKEIDILLISKNMTIVIIVKNPINKKIDVRSLSTTKKNKNYHGYGILQIENLLKKYNGEVFFDSSENEFKISMIINSNE